MSLDLVIGTHNLKKGQELAELLSPHGFRVVTLAELGVTLEVEEDGDSFAANAALKAVALARLVDRWVIADDSGLEVAALGGAPGIYSARFAGNEADDAANNRLLLEQLGDRPPEERSARYVCHATVADPSATVCAESHGTCDGRIRREPVGGSGFGYDPLFEVVEYHRTFGELGPSVKRAISHRSRALRQIVPQLLRLTRDGQWIG